MRLLIVRVFAGSAIPNFGAVAKRTSDPGPEVPPVPICSVLSALNLNSPLPSMAATISWLGPGPPGDHSSLILPS